MRCRQLMLLIMDMILINIAAMITLNFRLGSYEVPLVFYLVLKSKILIYTLIGVGSLYACKCYKSIWRYASIEEMMYIAAAGVITNVITMGYMEMSKVSFDISFYMMNMIMMVVLTGGARFAYRCLRRIRHMYSPKSSRKRVLVVGGGRAGSMVVKELIDSDETDMLPVGIIDDDAGKLGRKIHGVSILGGREDIRAIIKEYRIDEIIFAIASIGHKEKRELINVCKETKCKMKIIPGVNELIDGKVEVKKIRDVDIHDLLGREPVKLDMKKICGYICDKTVLVTGGGGSIGSELCRQIASYSPKKLIILDIYENTAYEIQQELRRKYKENLDLEVIIACVKDRNAIKDVFERLAPQVVFHAAAHKHVPLMEDAPVEAVKNNVFGTLNVARMASLYKAEKFVLISTDKAVNPTNIMGATKRLSEMIIQTIDKTSDTEFAAVRFGNVLGSNGSVIPLFKRQIEEGGPVTVTHEDIIRYFMTIPEAVQLVLQAGSMAKGGEIFVLDMGEPVKIINLARDLIRLSGFEPDKDIEVKVTGLRPGEKLYEELLMKEEGLRSTVNSKIFIGKPMMMDVKRLEKEIEILEKVIFQDKYELVEVMMMKLVPTYKKMAV